MELLWVSKPWRPPPTTKKSVSCISVRFFFFLVGGLLALLFRIQLALPENDFSPDEYNLFFTLHGTTMIFLAAMPMIAGFMNYGCRCNRRKRSRLPRINAMGFGWVFQPAHFHRNLVR